MTDLFSDALDTPGKSLQEQVEAFRAQCKINEKQKKRSGRRLYARLKRGSKNKLLLRQFLMAFNTYDTDYNYIRYSGDAARHASSFRAAMTMRTRRLKTQGAQSCPEWVLWDKPKGAQFAQMLGLRVAQQYGSHDRGALRFEPGTVIKPVDGSQSQGVYLLFSEDHICDVYKNEVFSGYDALADRIYVDQQDGRVPRDRWIIEELMSNRDDPSGTAVDWKFLTCYGEVIVIALMRRFPKDEQVWFSPEGNKDILGFSLPSHSLDVPEIPAGYLELAKKISLEIPAPFVRVDLLQTDQGPALGEFTARTQFWYRFGRQLDITLGDAFIAAEVRLQQDLLNGKDFSIWKEFTATLSGADENNPTGEKA